MLSAKTGPLQPTVRGHAVETSSCLATAKLLGRGVGPTLTVQSCAPTLAEGWGRRMPFFSSSDGKEWPSYSLEEPGPWLCHQGEVMLRGMGCSGDAGGMKQTCQKCALAALTTARQMSFLAALYLQPMEEPLTWRCEGGCCLQAQQRLCITCPCPLPCTMCQGRRGPCSLPQAQQHRGQQPSCN